VLHAQNADAEATIVPLADAARASAFCAKRPSHPHPQRVFLLSQSLFTSCLSSLLRFLTLPPRNESLRRSFELLCPPPPSLPPPSCSARHLCFRARPLTRLPPRRRSYRVRPRRRFGAGATPSSIRSRGRRRSPRKFSPTQISVEASRGALEHRGGRLGRISPRPTFFPTRSSTRRRSALAVV
jgi:hypothetical protein